MDAKPIVIRRLLPSNGTDGPIPAELPRYRIIDKPRYEVASTAEVLETERRRKNRAKYWRRNTSPTRPKPTYGEPF